MVFFFDEAHLLFKDISRAFLNKIEQVVKLIRSKGVGIYFITQSPKDIPDEVLSQLGNKVQHALRAYTPSDQKAVRAAAASFRENPAFNTAETLMSLGTGEALISVLDNKGIPAYPSFHQLRQHVQSTLFAPCPPTHLA
jgi:DNA helicase HerA-like ATPase